PLGAQAQAAPSAAGIERFTLTVLGTTDLHNNVFNWDYFKNAPYADYRGNNVGIAQAATLIKAIRAERGVANTLTIDAGDTIQGTPLAHYFAKISPASDSVKHPMALAMNAVGYDAVASGIMSSTTVYRSCARGRSSWTSRSSAPTSVQPGAGSAPSPRISSSGSTPETAG
ncbi:trifunctional nucleotide phosphoesterase protein YfkN, partial [Arthrobacter sp. Hiyo6]